MDQTGTLDAAQTQALENRLAGFERSHGSQIVFLLINSTLPEDITDYAQRVGDSWKIGRQNIGDGLLLVVAKNDRTVRIATTKALEGAIPDLAAKLIIDQAITPRFRQGDFAGGLDAAAEQIMARISGENLPTPADSGQPSGKPDGFEWPDLAVFLFFAVPIGAKVLSAIFGRKLAALATGGVAGSVVWMLTGSLLLGLGAALLGLVVALFASLGSLGGGSGRSSRYSGGGWSSGRGGGGFSSGGGGDFGGGGASGKW